MRATPRAAQVLDGDIGLPPNRGRSADEHSTPIGHVGNTPGIGELLNVSLQRLNDAFNESRRIARALRPALLDDLGLQAAIDA